MEYGSYLKLDRLLTAQEPESLKQGREAHDEMLFIVIHQAYELWFKQILHELERVGRIFGGRLVDDAELSRAVHAAERVVKIAQLIVSQIDVLETMTPMDFLEFRDLLVPASGFQSVQFRLIETRLGLTRSDRLKFDGSDFDARLPDDARLRIAAAEAQPSLRAEIDQWLSRTPFVEMGGFDFRAAYDAAIDRMLKADIETIRRHPQLTEPEKRVQIASLETSSAMFDALLDDARFEAVRADGGWTMSRRALQAALFIFLYRDEPALQLPFRMLRALMDIDEQMALWRLRHALMVSRMIGRKVGTGGSSGYDYLRGSAERHRVYNDLFAIATFLIPRSDLPPLPQAVRASMRYRYEGM
ncbi:MAG: tryptophan 2,3-dioxygenase [Alphaproteobacteria bacterium]|nr:tryptophan 2,3-dioxygenase [Alphaproteobacteria bacterium]